MRRTKLIPQFIKPHRWLCAAAVLLLIIDVTGSLIVSTPDFGTDAALRKALASKAKNAAVLITAQRISTIQQADLIIDLHESRTAGNDRHEEPLKTGSGSLRVRGVYTKYLSMDSDSGSVFCLLPGRETDYDISIRSNQPEAGPPAFQGSRDAGRKILLRSGVNQPELNFSYEPLGGA